MGAASSAGLERRRASPRCPRRCARPRADRRPGSRRLEPPARRRARAGDRRRHAARCAGRPPACPAAPRGSAARSRRAAGRRAAGARRPRAAAAGGGRGACVRRAGGQRAARRPRQRHQHRDEHDRSSKPIGPLWTRRRSRRCVQGPRERADIAAPPFSSTRGDRMKLSLALARRALWPWPCAGGSRGCARRHLRVHWHPDRHRQLSLSRPDARHALQRHIHLQSAGARYQPPSRRRQLSAQRRALRDHRADRRPRVPDRSGLPAVRAIRHRRDRRSGRARSLPGAEHGQPAGRRDTCRRHLLPARIPPGRSFRRRRSPRRRRMSRAGSSRTGSWSLAKAGSG